MQFYEDDGFLIDSVNKYLLKGFSDGDAAIVIATAEHREAMEQKLKQEGVNLASLRAAGKYFPYDAAETLARFMVDGRPDAKRFGQVVGSAVAQATRGGSRVRAFGEMAAHRSNSRNFGTTWPKGSLSRFSAPTR